MKKLSFSLLLIAALCFAACGNNQSKKAEAAVQTESCCDEHAATKSCCDEGATKSGCDEGATKSCCSGEEHGQTGGDCCGHDK